jgi:hypothetical protein
MIAPSTLAVAIDVVKWLYCFGLGCFCALLNQKMEQGSIESESVDNWNPLNLALFLLLTAAPFWLNECHR